jgi:hypothetical protein
MLLVSTVAQHALPDPLVVWGMQQPGSSGLLGL